MTTEHATKSGARPEPEPRVTAAALGSDRAIECRDPATLELLGSVPVMGPEQVRAVVARARVAQRDWSTTSFAERRAVMRALLDAILARQAEICRLCVRDSGKTMVDAELGEILPVCEKLRYVMAHGERDLAPERRASGPLAHKRARVEYEPLGVVGVLCPWNFPFHNLYCPLVPALFAGNAVVAKVSEWTSWSAAALVAIVRDVLRERGHSPDLVGLVTGYGETGAALVSGGVDKVFFTGSPENGKKVMETAARSLTPVVLELGGKDPMIVCDDADLDHAARQAMLGVFTACGQMCVGAERIYVHAGVYDAFLEKVTRSVRALRQGPAPLFEAGPADPSRRELVDVGAMTMPRQLEILEALVGDAVQKGARVLVGGKRAAGLGGQFFEPTLLVDVTHAMRITQEEQFGPIMVVMRFGSDQEAVRLANDCPYGLGASVFSRDAARAARITREVRAGMAVVNDYGLAYMIQSLPFGGIGRSGFGRINGREGLRACCHTKALVTDRVPLGAGVAVYPVRRETFGVLEHAARLVYGRGLGTRAQAALGAARAVVRMLRGR
ncbi:MAG: aldehyde dehydrogenase family protein [Polyangiaceae bacterium]|nr:aldehyde dehydrogenase family protein [Polyangiaceae bacterium]